MPSLRESQDIKKALRGNETPKDYLLKWETQYGASGNKKRLSFDSLFSTEMEGFEPSRHVNDLYP